MAGMEEHMASDELVGWDWPPGSKRTPAPGTQARLGALFKVWAESGGYCPARHGRAARSGGPTANAL
jgi:hypothetical protein